MSRVARKSAILFSVIYMILSKSSYQNQSNMLSVGGLQRLLVCKTAQWLSGSVSHQLDT